MKHSLSTRNSRTVRQSPSRWFLAMVGVSSLFCGAAQAGNIDNLRFVDKDLNVTIIGPGQPAPGLIQGDLVGEVEFQSDLRDVNTGEFSYGDMTA